MNWIMYFIMFILGAISMFMMVCIGYAAKQEEPVNRVHFYVARNKSGALCLYMGKPLRCDCAFYTSLSKGGTLLACGEELQWYHLNENDYKDLKWEDEPLEVFVNMED